MQTRRGRKTSNVADPPVMTFATDCTGMDAMRTSMQRLAPVEQLEYLFASDVNNSVRDVISKQRLKPRVVYGDITARDVSDVTLGSKGLDLYVSGPPCQSFSGLGHRGAMENGLKDERCQVFLHVIQTIEATRPRIFIIENVKRLLSANDVWQAFQARLRNITTSEGHPAYNIDFKLISPHELGFPQSRMRLFVIGRHVDLGEEATVAFDWPEPVVETPHIRDLILPDDEAMSREPTCARLPCPSCLRGINIAKEKVRESPRLLQQTDERGPPYLINATGGVDHVRFGQPGLSPCLTSRSDELWVLRELKHGKLKRRPGRVVAGRYLTSEEMMRIQGFRDDDFEANTFERNKSRRAKVTMIGNSIHVDVLTLLLRPCIALLRAHDRRIAPKIK